MPTTRLAKRMQSPQVFIDQDAFNDMLCISRATKDEVAWFAQVDALEDNVFIIRDVYLPKQQSSGTTVEIEPEHLILMADEYIEEYGNEAFNRLHCWGHSHGSMGVTPSHQDDTTIDDLCAAINKPFLAIRVNHKGAYQVDVAYPNGVTVVDANAQVGWVTQKQEAFWKDLVTQRVSRIQPPAGKWNGAFGKTIWPAVPPTPKAKAGTAMPGSATEQDAMITEALSHIVRFADESPDDYLARVDAIEALEDERDSLAIFGHDYGEGDL